MAETQIIRSLTEDEKKEMHEIGKLTTREKIRRLINQKEAEATKEHVPYDRKGALNELDEKIENVIRKIERAGTKVDETSITIDFDADKFADKKRFKLLSIKEQREDKLLDNMRQSVITGYWECYKTIDGGYGVDVFIPIDVWNERQKKK